MRIVSPTIHAAEESIERQVETIAQLSTVASKYPYYRFVPGLVISYSVLMMFSYNGMWSRDVQNTVGLLSSNMRYEKARLIILQCFAIILCGWLGGCPLQDFPAHPGRLLTIEEVGKVMKGS